MIKPRKKTPAKKKAKVANTKEIVTGKGKKKSVSSKKEQTKKKVTKKKRVPKNKGGRPSKIKTFIEATEETLKELKDELFVLTDEELLFVINEKLIKKEQICKSTFEKWKKKAIDSAVGTENDVPEFFEEFLRLIKKALLLEKRNLFVKLQGAQKDWTRFAWIIERKFSEWNLKHISEIDNKSSQLPTKIVIVSDNEK